ncbi:MAG: radical SAM protein [Bacillota bacterium]
MSRIPSYRQLGPAALEDRANQALSRLTECNLCPHLCRINRKEGLKGICRAGPEAIISSYGPHFGEERPLVGKKGSGTIFFAYCSLKCVFCQNWEISWGGEGQPVSNQELAEMMIDLAGQGCHNINLVTPTHFVPQILAALAIAADKGLSIPLVYNCGGYETLDTLTLLDGIVDIYMPDFKYSKNDAAYRYSGVKDYAGRAKEALREMYRQVGDLQLDEQGIALRGLLVRHLVMPEDLAGTEEVLRFLATEISPALFVNVMRQYYPAYKAKDYPPLDRPLTRTEFRQALEHARQLGLNILD